MRVPVGVRGRYKFEVANPKANERGFEREEKPEQLRRLRTDLRKEPTERSVLSAANDRGRLRARVLRGRRRGVSQAWVCRMISAKEDLTGSTRQFGVEGETVAAESERTDVYSDNRR